MPGHRRAGYWAISTGQVAQSMRDVFEEVSRPFTYSNESYVIIVQKERRKCKINIKSINVAARTDRRLDRSVPMALVRTPAQFSTGSPHTTIQLLSYGHYFF